MLSGAEVVQKSLDKLNTNFGFLFVAYSPWPSTSPLYKLCTNIGLGLLWAWNGNRLGVLRALIGPKAWTGLVVGMDFTC